MTPEQEIRHAALNTAVAIHSAPNKYGSGEREILETAASFAHFIETGWIPAEEGNEAPHVEAVAA
jgi:hypothetical protein